MTATTPLDGRSLDRQSDTACIADVSRRLLAEFGTELPEGTVTTVVRDANHDLAGQIPVTALAEMLERLARYRLDSMVGTTDRG